MEPAAIMEKKLENIELELYNLKSAIIKLTQQPQHKKVVKLKGLLKGMIVSENETKEAEKSLFKIGA